MFNGSVYKQSSGAAIGKSVSPFFANICLSALETSLSGVPIFPRVWLRYVDDVFAIVKRDQIGVVLDMLNGYHSDINFSLEVEINGKLPFLDLEISHNEGVIEIDIYRKPTSVQRYITVDSHHNWQHKSAAFHSMLHRLCNVPLSPSNYERELDYIKHIAHVNGYADSFVSSILGKCKKKKLLADTTTLQPIVEMDTRRVCLDYYPEVTNNLKKVFRRHDLTLVTSSKTKLMHAVASTKDKVDLLDSSGIYSIQCSMCSATYVGQTRRSIGERFSEHFSYIKNNHPSKSTIAKHVLENNHGISRDRLQLLKCIVDQKYLDAYERYFIMKEESCVNRDSEAVSTLFSIL